MNSRLFGTAAALVAAVATVTCKDDPTATLSGGATRLLISPNPLFLTEGGATGSFTVSAVNDALRPVRATISVTSPNPSVATVVEDLSNPDPNGTVQRFTVTSAAAGQVLLAVSGAGLTGNDTINVLPPAWNGTNSGAPVVGQEFTLYSTALLKFDDSSDVDFGGARGIITNVHAESLKIIVPHPPVAQPAAWLLSNVSAGGVLLSFPTADLFTITNPFDPNDLPDPAAIVGEGTFYDGFASGAASCTASAQPVVCNNFYRLTLAAPASVTFQLLWDGPADADLLVCDAGCNAFLGGPNAFGGATGANNPEEVTMDLPAGTHNLWINVFDGNDAAPYLYRVTIGIN